VSAGTADKVEQLKQLLEQEHTLSGTLAVLRGDEGRRSTQSDNVPEALVNFAGVTWGKKANNTCTVLL